jgi:pyridoxine kinase
MVSAKRHKRPPLVVAISSHVAYGAVGNRAVVFALESLGLRTCAIHTVQLPYHPGHGAARRVVLSPHALTDFLAQIAANRDIDPPAAIVTGYFANPGQVAAVAEFTGRLKARLPDVLVVCDPVIGDAGGLYVGPRTAAAIRERLLPLADVATPNLHELAWLRSKPVAANPDEAGVQARALGPPIVLVTSAPAAGRRSMANLLVLPKAVWIVEHPTLPGPGNGQGDLTAGLFCGHLVAGRSPREALARTSSAVVGVMRRSETGRSAELALAGSQAIIAAPQVMLAARRVR